MAERKATTLLWDLDDTIGDFRGMRLRTPEFSEPIRLRYGIREVLTEFSEQNGFCSYITSSAGVGFATEGLRRTFLDKKFAGVFGNDTVQQTIDGKHYRQLFPHVPPDEMRSSMIVIGDSSHDKPVDIGGMVFLELGDHLEPLDAFVVREILVTLLENGDGNIKKGYEKLYSEAKPIDTSNPVNANQRQINIGNDISFTMEYRTAEEVSREDEHKVPVICKIRSEEHKKPFEVFF